MTWSTACPDWQRRLEAGESLVPDLPLFEEERDRALRIFDRLRLPDVIGTPAMSDAAGDWFRDIVAALFGSYDAEANRRMVQELFLLVPKKNGKSSYAAAIMVVAMIVNRRPSAEFLLIAPTKEIAGIAYRQAKGIIKLDEELLKLFHTRDHIKTIEHRRTGATLQIKAADTDVITGSKSTGILVDETHVFAKKSNASEIFVEIRGALAARPDGFMIQITTQSKEPPVGLFKAELALARDIRDGNVQLPRLAVLYELPEQLAKDDGWKDPRVWPLVNPNMGRSVDRQFLENQLLAAEQPGAEPGALALLASQHFNVEVGLALRNDAWAGARYWTDACDDTLTLDELLHRSEVVVAGIDGGGLDDLAGLGVLGRCKKTRDWLLWNHAWAQPDVFERRKDIVSRLEDFIAEGTLTLCDSPTGDILGIADTIELIKDAGLLPETNAIGLDPQGVAALVDELVARGITDAQMTGISQGFRLSSAVWGMERKLKDGTLWHSGQGLMTWCVGNAKVEQRGNAVLITKQTAGKAKIDPLVASFNAVMLMSRNPEAASGPSVYEDRGMLVL
ncbi:phage terminase large subunit-like protein [Sphingomonas kaistensis]|uniref:Phage terminase large subunit-like protein n=1 Tax=Sphingomonas kaistensis TaxID=298708 RepID=A0A7X5Y8J4_9SPHN|nr:terminase large subunit [Sphingomonas kaistensis]NJC06527.1 phage terminase large subunit-like protein [Sphingomonas kaistensis]